MNASSQVYLTNFTFTGWTNTAPTQLNIYANSNRTGLVTSSTSNSGFSYTFDGLTALTFGTKYYAFYPSNVSVTGQLSVSNVYSGGDMYTSGNAFPFESRFTATLSDTSAATPVPFDFEPTGAVVILGGLWGLKRWAKKKSQG